MATAFPVSISCIISIYISVYTKGQSAVRRVANAPGLEKKEKKENSWQVGRNFVGESRNKEKCVIPPPPTPLFLGAVPLRPE